MVMTPQNSYDLLPCFSDWKGGLNERQCFPKTEVILWIVLKASLWYSKLKLCTLRTKNILGWLDFKDRLCCGKHCSFQSGDWFCSLWNQFRDSCWDQCQQNQAFWRTLLCHIHSSQTDRSLFTTPQCPWTAGAMVETIRLLSTIRRFETVLAGGW